MSRSLSTRLALQHPLPQERMPEGGLGQPCLVPRSPAVMEQEDSAGQGRKSPWMAPEQPAPARPGACAGHMGPCASKCRTHWSLTQGCRDGARASVPRTLVTDTGLLRWSPGLVLAHKAQQPQRTQKQMILSAKYKPAQAGMSLLCLNDPRKLELAFLSPQ